MVKQRKKYKCQDMTFKQIQSSVVPYINQKGIVFTPVKKFGKMQVSFDIDATTAMGIISSTTWLTEYFGAPHKVDYSLLYNYIYNK